MKPINKYIKYRQIKESIDNNLFWKIDHYFKGKPNEQYEFNKIVDYCRENVINAKQLENYLNNHNFSNLKKFVDFIEDIIQQDNTDKDYTYILYKIINLIISNKKYGNKYTNKKLES